MDNQRTAQCSVEEDRVVKESIDECMYQLGNEKITHTEYNNLIQQQPKEIVDEVIHRIIEHPYWNCLNKEVIIKWCTEAKKRAYQTKRNSFNNFHQREYDYDELEQLLLNSTVHTMEGGIADVS